VVITGYHDVFGSDGGVSTVLGLCLEWLMLSPSLEVTEKEFFLLLYVIYDDSVLSHVIVPVL